MEHQRLIHKNCQKKTKLEMAQYIKSELIDHCRIPKCQHCDYTYSFYDIIGYEMNDKKRCGNRFDVFGGEEKFNLIGDKLNSKTLFLDHVMQHKELADPTDYEVVQTYKRVFRDIKKSIDEGEKENHTDCYCTFNSTLETINNFLKINRRRPKRQTTETGPLNYKKNKVIDYYVDTIDSLSEFVSTPIPFKNISNKPYVKQFKGMVVTKFGEYRVKCPYCDCTFNKRNYDSFQDCLSKIPHKYFMNEDGSKVFDSMEEKLNSIRFPMIFDPEYEREFRVK